MKHLSKGQTLLSLLGRLKYFKIPTLEVFDKEHYDKNKQLIWVLSPKFKIYASESGPIWANPKN